MNTKIPILKGLDKLVGLPLINLAYFFIKPNRGPVLHPSSFLLIRPGGIGDAVLLIPAIKAIKNKYPDAQIDVLAEKRNCGVFSLCPEIRNVYLYDRPRELWRAVRNDYDVVIDTEQWHRMSAVVARLTKAPVSIGFATNERRKLFTHQIPYSHDDYEVESFLHLIEPIVDNVDFDTAIPFLIIPNETAEKVRHYLHTLSSSKVVAIFPGGSIPERRWGADGFHGVAGRLAERGFRTVVVGGKDDISDGKKLAKDIPDSLNLCGTLSLLETAAVLKKSALLISGDSGILHIGYGLGIKTLALFGPGMVAKWAPPESAVINRHLACSPCTKFGYTPECKKEAECMKLITVDEVYKKAVELLEG